MIIWLASYPRSGNTFFRVLLNSVFAIKTHSIYDDRFDIGADERLSNVVGHEFLPEKFTLDAARCSDEACFLKTHDYPADVCGDDKVIYLLRDGRESVLSYYNYHNDYTDQKKSLLDIIDGDTQFGGWGEHVLAWEPWKRANTLLVKFEDLVSDPLGQVSRIAEFTGLKPVSDVLPTFEELQSTGPRFFRSGKTDSWKKVFSEFDLHAFWQRNYTQMVAYGYEQGLPELFRSHPREAAYLSAKQLMDRLPAAHRDAEPPPLDAGTAIESPEESICRQGELLFQKGDFDGAESSFLDAIRYAPGFADGYNNLGVLWWQKGAPTQALEYFEAGLRLAPDHRELICNTATVLAALGREQEARELFDLHHGSAGNDGPSLLASQPPVESQAAEIDTASTATLVSIGEAAYARGDVARAETCFLEAYNLDTEDVVVCNNLVVLYWESGDPERALHYLEEAMRLDPENRELVVNAGQILAALGRESDAQILYSAFLERGPSDEEVSRLLESITGDRPDKAPGAASHASSGESLGEGDAVQAGAARIGAGHDGRFIVDVGCHRYDDDSPKVSVVIPSFNQGEFLEDTIRSVLDQEYPNLEIIVMDGGSSDGSVDIIRKYDRQISYWKSAPDKGQYWAVDAGFRMSTGDIMTWINSDDKLHPGSLRTVASIFTQLKEVEWVTGTPNTMNDIGKRTWVCAFPPVYDRAYYLAKKYDFPAYIQQEGTFWRRSLWEKAGGGLKTSLKMAGDLELWMRFFRHARLYTADTFLGCFRQHGGQKTATRMELYREEALRELDEEATRYGNPPQKSPGKTPVIRFANRNGTSSAADNYTATAPGTREILVSAIVSTYNSERYIEGCLQDLVSQTIADQLEIIVVDSGSQENEQVIVERYRSRFPNIRYIRTDKRETVYAAWNRAVRQARGEFLTNANTDDRHRSDAFEQMVSALQKEPDVALVYADCYITATPNASFENAAVVGKYQWPEFDARLLFASCYVGPQPMWRRSLHDKYGGFDEGMEVAGDYDFWLRMVPNETFKHINAELGLYLVSPGSVEHGSGAVGGGESELARLRNWPSEWGDRPAPGGSYLVRISGRSGSVNAVERVLVTVVMPTKNRPELLGRAIDSVIAQTYPHWELIIVNDGGADVSAVVSGRESSSRVRCVALERSVGQAGARNVALRQANGEIICYLDDDDRYLPTHLETVVRALCRDDRAFVYTDAVLVPELHKGGLLQEVGERSNPYRHDDYSRDRLMVSNYIPINTWAHWKTCLDAVGVFDETLNCYEDWEFLLRFSARYAFNHIKQTTVEVMFRVDRVDNVTRHRLADTAAAFRAIYERHGDHLSEQLLHERAVRLQALARNAEQVHYQEQEAARRVTPDAGEREAVGRTQHLQVLRDRFLERAERTGYALPSIHLVMPVDEQDITKIADTIESLAQQIYSGWGLSVISTLPVPQGEFDCLPMVEWIQADDVATAFVDIARSSEADWLARVTPGDVLEPEALSVFVDYINLNPEWRFIYSDEDCIDAGGRQVRHKFKPDINPEYLCASPYTGNLSMVHRDILGQSCADFGVPAAVFHDLALKVMDSHGTSAIGHIATLLYHQSLDNEHLEASATWLKPVLEAYVYRHRLDARVQQGAVDGTCMIDYRHPGEATVCIAIYVGGDATRVERTLSTLLHKTACANWVMRVGVNCALAPLFANYNSERVRIDAIEDDVRRADYFTDLAQTIDTEFIVFLDPGVIVLQDNWLDRMLAQGRRPEVGVVGVRLLSPQNKVAHAGIVTGIGSFGVGGCVGEGEALEVQGYMHRNQVVQSLSAVSSACMLVRRSLYCSLRGFDAELAVQIYSDVDFCLKVKGDGKRVVWTPFVTMLIADERLDTYSGAGGYDRVVRDADRVRSRWLQSLAHDPSYNRNLGLKKADFAPDTEFCAAWDPNIEDLPNITGCGYGAYVSWAYRIAQPLEALSAAGRARYANIPFKGRSLEPLPSVVEMQRRRPDTLLLQNALHDSCLETLRQYRSMGNMFMVLSQDDLMFAIPPKHPSFNKGYKDIKKRLRACLSMMDRLVVTCEPLADELSAFIADICVVPNSLDPRMWGQLNSVRGAGIRPRVGWAGAMQHLGDLEVLADTVRATADEVDWIFMGMCPDFLRPYAKEVHEYVAFSAYPEKLAKLNLDIAVAPLEHNRFNRCKSDLRLLEYGAMGWPVIATDIEPYREAPVHRVPNQTRAWVEAIRSYAHDLDAAWKTGDGLRQWVRDNRILDAHVDDWFHALQPDSRTRRSSLVEGKAANL